MAGKYTTDKERLRGNTTRVYHDVQRTGQERGNTARVYHDVQRTGQEKGWSLAALLCVTMSFDWFARAIAFYIRFRGGKWKKYQLI